MAADAPALAATLAMVADALADARDDWWIIGSAAVALHGARGADAADVDVLLSVADARRILPALGLPAAAGGAHPDFRSALFGRWTAPPVAVELMAGFSYRRGRDWRPVAPATRVLVPLGGAAGRVLPVPDRAELAALLAGFGRAKDVARAALLAALDPPGTKGLLPGGPARL